MLDDIDPQRFDEWKANALHLMVQILKKSQNSDNTDQAIRNNLAIFKTRGKNDPLFILFSQLWQEAKEQYCLSYLSYDIPGLKGKTLATKFQEMGYIPAQKHQGSLIGKKLILYSDDDTYHLKHFSEELGLTGDAPYVTVISDNFNNKNRIIKVKGSNETELSYGVGWFLVVPEK